MNDQFLRAFFSLILGWTRAIMAFFWKIFGQEGGSGFQNWFRQNWIMLVLSVCIIGTAIDFLVYLFRWRPLRVWATFFRRAFHRNGAEVSEDVMDGREKNRIALRTATEEAAPRGDIRFHEIPEQFGHAGPMRDMQENGRRSESVFVSDRRNYSSPQKAFPHEESEQREVARNGFVISEENSRRERAEAIRRTRKRFQWSEILGSDEQSDSEIAYRRPEPAFDKLDAYREPVYPDQWKNRNRQGETKND